MRDKLLISMCSCAFALTAAAADHPGSAKPQQSSVLRTITPIFSQLLVADMPISFRVANEETGAGSYLREAVLPGETVDHWTQMITVTGIRGLSGEPDVTPESVANTLAGNYRKACPDSFAGQGSAVKAVDGSPAYVALMSCGTSSASGEPVSETAVVMVIKGVADYYSVQWAGRGKPSAVPLALDEHPWIARLQQMQPIMLCKKNAGEKAPYPSCLDRVQRLEEADAAGGS